MRPKQWTKNGLLFAGLVFSGYMREPGRWVAAIAGFAVFCALSGVVYIYNDLRDVESDRLHPRKRRRPIASGNLPVGAAWAGGLAVASAGLVSAFALNRGFGLVATTYFVLMLLYSAVLKHMVVLDLLVVAVGFVIRAIAGVRAIELPGESIPVTPWFLVCIMFGAFFIVICKRRHELLLLTGDAAGHRPVLEYYSEPFLDQMVSLATAGTVVSYALYAILGVQSGPGPRPAHPEWLVYTVPIVLYGVCRYLYLVYRRDEGGAPESLLLQDRAILATVLTWIAFVTVIFYVR